MPSYEAMFILRPDLEEEPIQELSNKLQDLLKQFGVQESALEEWGKRRLAYEIKKYGEGLYYLLKFEGSQELVPELEHFFKVNDEVIRFMIVRQEE